ncbi:MAG: XdhC/CoxF family protein [Sphingomonadales bacterium]|nr:XdhC/CoxF family protein [Sphingomonadales bacterium]
MITRGHAYDEPCLRVVLPSEAKYIGMIGSKRRVKACFQRFRDEEKIAEELIERVYAPIGLDIATETPAEIALAILGEVIKVRRGGKAASNGASRKTAPRAGASADRRSERAARTSLRHGCGAHSGLRDRRKPEEWHARPADAGRVHGEA